MLELPSLDLVASGCADVVVAEQGILHYFVNLDSFMGGYSEHTPIMRKNVGCSLYALSCLHQQIRPDSACFHVQARHSK